MRQYTKWPANVKKNQRILSSKAVFGKMFGDLASNGSLRLLTVMMCETEEQFLDVLFQGISGSELRKQAKVKLPIQWVQPAGAAVHPTPFWGRGTGIARLPSFCITHYLISYDSLNLPPFLFLKIEGKSGERIWQRIKYIKIKCNAFLYPK